MNYNHFQTVNSLLALLIFLGTLTAKNLNYKNRIRVPHSYNRWIILYKQLFIFNWCYLHKLLFSLDTVSLNTDLSNFYQQLDLKKSITDSISILRYYS